MPTTAQAANIPSDTSFGTWDSTNRIYTLNTNLTEGIVIDGSNFTLDGNGHTVEGPGSGNGVYLYAITDITIKNLTVQSFMDGIYLSSSNDNTLQGNTVSDNSGYGIRLDSSTSNTIFNNYFNNASNFHFDGTIYSNTWNTTEAASPNIVGGPSLGGNFWAEPTNDGFSQTHPDTDGDGFCDQEYDLASGNVDNLPLAPPPPQVVSVTLNPPSPVGIGPVTFTITFSENMDNSVSPTVTFGKTDPYNEHIITKTSYSADTWTGTFSIEAGYDDE